jgi:hypothetical protein
MKLSDKEISDKFKQFDKIDNLKNKLSEHFNSIYSDIQIDRKQVFDALFIMLSDKYDLEWIGDLWDIDITYDEAKKVLSNFDFNTINNVIETNEEIIPRDLLIQYKVRIKSKGLIWIIHKNDMDPFPSSPHAHQLDNNIKLDLSNGKCYKKKQLMYTLKKRDLLIIREKANMIYKGELPKLKL